jgi:glycosyltransferase involved in cell wall biosynthesis
MKIAFCVRNDFITRRGGDSIQILKTKEKIESLYKDCSIDIIINPSEINANYDLVHIYNLLVIKDCLSYYRTAKKIGIKVALSSIYGLNSYLGYVHLGKYLGYKINKCKFDFMDKIGTALSWICKHPYLLSNEFKKYAREIINGSDILLPNSNEEKEYLFQLSGQNRSMLEEKSFVVFNAVDKFTADESDKSEIDINVKDYILQVGRIEPRKNQIGTVRALYKENDIPIVFLGKTYPNQKDYFFQLKRIADTRGNVYFFDEIPHDEIPLFYKKALVHVLPSLQETTGLVSLEALSLGCKICVSSRNFTPVDTYFKGIATIVDPLDIQSIHDGIFREINTPRDMDTISRFVLDTFNWNVTAKQTYKAYCFALKKT